MKNDEDRFDDNKGQNLLILQSVYTKEILSNRLLKKLNKLLKIQSKRCPQLNKFQELEN